MSRMILLMALVLVGAVVVGCTVSRGEDSTPTPAAPQPPDRVVSHLKIEPLDNSVVIAHGTLSVAQDDGGTKQIPVALKQGRYRCSAEITEDGRTERRQRDLWLSELAASEDSSDYVWTLWTGDRPQRLNLIANTPGSNFLVWVHAASVKVADVSGPRDRETTLRLRLSGKPDAAVIHVPVKEVLPEVGSWGVNDLGPDIEIVSVSRDQGGTWTIIIASPEGKKYTIVGDGQTWHLG